MGEDAAEINPVFVGTPQQKDREGLERLSSEASLLGQGNGLKWLETEERELTLEILRRVENHLHFSKADPGVS